MPILLCEQKSEDGEYGTWERLHKIPLAGSINGLIHKNWKTQGRPIKNGWHMSVESLLSTINYNSDLYTIASNLKPNDSNEIVYIRLTDIWAWADGNPETGWVDWIPMMLRFHEWYTKDISEEGDIASLKSNVLFKPNHGSTHGVSYEFLYLKGDASAQPWTWSRSGGLNGALLYSPVRQWFIEKMQETGGL